MRTGIPKPSVHSTTSSLRFCCDAAHRLHQVRSKKQPKWTYRGFAWRLHRAKTDKKVKSATYQQSRHRFNDTSDHLHPRNYRINVSVFVKKIRKGLKFHRPMSQYTYNLISALSDHTIALMPLKRHSMKSQKHRKATPRFQLCRKRLVKSTRRSIADAKMLKIGKRG